MMICIHCGEKVEFKPTKHGGLWLSYHTRSDGIVTVTAYCDRPLGLHEGFLAPPVQMSRTNVEEWLSEWA